MSHWKDIKPLQAVNMANCVTLADRASALNLVPKGGVVTEIGVAYGDFSKLIFDVISPSVFYAIDMFQTIPGNEFWSETRLADSGLSHLEYFRNRFKAEEDIGRFQVKQGMSWEMLKTFDDNFFDFAYLDAGHDYKSVKQDIEILKHKVKDGGYIQFNDYTLWSIAEQIEYGVVQAVHEFVNGSKHQLKAFCLHATGYHDILVQINK